MGIIRKIGEVAKFSQTSARAQTNPNGQNNNPSPTLSNSGPESKPTEMTIIDGVADGGAGHLAEKNRSSPNIMHGEGADSKDVPKPFKEKLKRQASAVEVERKSSGLQGGLASSAALKKTVKDPVQNPLAEQNNPTTLVNTGAGTGKISTQQNLAGGIENKATGSQVDPEKGAQLVTDFGVPGGLGADIASDKLEEEDTKKAVLTEKNPIGSNTVEKTHVATEKPNPPQKSAEKDSPSTRAAGHNSQDNQSQTGSKNEATAAEGASNASGAKPDGQGASNGENKGNEPEEVPDSTKKTPQTQPSPKVNQDQDESSGNRKYESRPSASPGSMLARDRENPGIVYEAPAYKQRYFLQFLWTRRHFTISRDGILKYYRNTSGKRRQEFDLKKDFVSIKKQNAKSKTHPYRIVFIAQKEDYLAFDNPEMRDEFLHWLSSKATE